MKLRGQIPHLPDDFDIGSSGTILRADSVDDPYNVALHHANIVSMAFLGSHDQEMFNEVHDIGSGVHVVLSTGIR